MGIKLHKLGTHILCFRCPGCGNAHMFDMIKKPGWTWNGSMDLPTFFPSLMVNSHDVKNLCHSFVKDGKIQYLTDCHHALKGQTVDLPDWDADDPS